VINIFVFKKIACNADKTPDKIICMDEKRQINAKQFLTMILNSREILLKWGIKPGETVILDCKNQLDFVLSLFCLFYNQNWIIPLSSITMSHEMDSIKNQINVKQISRECINEITTISETASEKINMPQVYQTGIYHLTSGTTDLSKLCIRTLNNLESEGRSYQTTLSLTPDDRIISASPLFHSYAMGAAIMGAFISGSLLYTINDFIPRKIIRIIEKNQISILYLVPFMAKALSKVHIEKESDMSCLRIVLVGAGSVNKEVHEKFEERFGICLSGNYGSTETGGMTIRMQNDPYDSIGRSMDGVRLKICDDNNNFVPTGETGEIWVKSPSMMKNYNDGSIKMDVEGFIPTGDIAFKDIHENYYIKGRKKMFIDIGSKKVNPFEIEEMIKRHPKVTECVISSFRRSNNTVAIKAIIVGKQLKEEEIRSYCKKNINTYSLPSVIEIRKSIPKNALGKVIRANL
jgi:long-chain acyl-CoA synthetase